MKNFPNSPVNPNAFPGSPKTEKSNILGFLTTGGGLRKRSTSQPRASSVGSSFNTDIKNRYGAAENVLKKGIWASRSKVADSGEKENEMQVNTDMNLNRRSEERGEAADVSNGSKDGGEESKFKRSSDVVGSDDVVSGFLYDKLQKEVINLRKFCEVKDRSLIAKDEEIKVVIYSINPPKITRLKFFISTYFC